MTMPELARLAELIRQRNKIGSEITRIIGRPCQIGHVGEYIASHVFGIDLEASAVSKAIDGRFREGPLAGRSVNVKLYAKREGLLDITPGQLPDYYLVMTGPLSQTLSSRGEVRPWMIETVYLFEAAPLVRELGQRGLQVGIATSVRREHWTAAEVFPLSVCQALRLTALQQDQLKMFAAC